MKKALTIAPLVLSLLGTAPAMADATKATLASYDQLEASVEGFDLSETLLVFDNDDTISTMPCQPGGACQYLGGAAWFTWQEHLLGSNSPYSVAGDFAELLDVSSLLFSVSDMQLTDASLPGKLSDLTAKGARFLVETARGKETVDATTRQFKALTFDHPTYKNMLDLVKANGLTMGDNESLPSPYQPCGDDSARPIVYQQGVMYLAGQNKGEMLRCLLNEYDQQDTGRPAIRNIVFVDDTPKNVEKVYQAFKGDSRYTVRAYHYTAFDAHKLALTDGPNSEKLQNKAKERWDALYNVLKAKIVTPAVR